MYRIANRRAHPVTLPNLGVAAKTKVLYAGRYHSFFKLKWQDTRRFVLTESCRSEGIPDLTGVGKEFNIKGRYYQVKKDADGSTSTVVFAAQAVCELGPGDTCRVLSIKPGNFSLWK